MKVIKRDGHMVDFSPDKIEAAIMKANAEVEEEDQASSTQIKNIIKYINDNKEDMFVSYSVETNCWLNQVK